MRRIKEKKKTRRKSDRCLPNLKLKSHIGSGGGGILLKGGGDGTKKIPGK
jgi:hypothetical protein